MHWKTLLSLLFIGWLNAACLQTVHSEPLSGSTAVVGQQNAIQSQTALSQPATSTTVFPAAANTAVALPTITPIPATATALPTTTSTARPPILPLPTVTAVASASPTSTPLATSTPVEMCRPAAATSPHISIAPNPWGRPAASANVIFHGPNDNRQFIHLSFDVEGNASVLDALLDVLDKHQVKTTMFIVGSWAEANSSWVIEIARRGHEFGNHSYSHTHLRQLTREQIQTELQQTETIVINLTGQSTKPWLRPPFGGYSEETILTAYEVGWTTVMWSGTGLDTMPDANEQTICNSLVEYAEPGAILLLHSSHPETVTAVDRFITEMHAQGYTFVPLSILLSDN